MKIFSCVVLFLMGVHDALAQQNELSPWRPGLMDIHHISTGRGNATYMIFPDGTTMLFDAGEISDTHERTKSERNSLIRPNASRSAYEWIADYIRQFAPKSLPIELDYAVISHFHDDHFGEWDSLRKRSDRGPYVLTGITGVADLVPVKRLLDRGHAWPVDLRSDDFRKRFEKDEYHIVQTLCNYFTFMKTQFSRGLVYDSLVVGASDQIRLVQNPASYPDWRMMNIAAGGKVATGFGNRESAVLYPMGAYPGENPLSVCLKISYGRFNYFTGGDIPGIDEHGSTDLQSMESQVAPVVGPVDVATLNHHGNRDSQNPYYVRTLRPRVWIQQTWSSDHPGHDVLRRISSTRLYPGPRDVFATDLLQANIHVMGNDLVEKAYTARSGHIVVRVGDGGDEYKVYVLDDRSVDRKVLSVHGPYQSR